MLLSFDTPFLFLAAQQLIDGCLISIKACGLVNGFPGFAVGVGQEVFPDGLHLVEQLQVAALQQIAVLAEELGMEAAQFFALFIGRKGLALPVFGC